jgi:hypothetical protein
METAEQYVGQLPRDPDDIFIYLIYKSGEPALLYEFSYAGMEEKINDTFLF